MNRMLLWASLVIAPLATFAADPPATPPLSPPDSLVADGIPPIPGDLPGWVGRYTESRAALIQDWNPKGETMLVATRFAETNQIHHIAQPGGARKQLTFFPDRVDSASFEPTKGDYFVFVKGVGGNEFTQNYRYDLATGDVTLLTDGKSKNSGPRWNNKGDRVAYTSTRRNGTDTDIYLEAPLDSKSDRKLAEVAGGGWQVEDWSPDDNQLLVLEEISANESYLWLFNAGTGERKAITSRDEKSVKVAYTHARFAKDGKGVLTTTDRDSEFQRIAHIDLASGKHTFLSPDTKFEVDDWELSGDGKSIAYTLNENGRSTLHISNLSTSNGTVALQSSVEPKFEPPQENVVINGLHWHPHANLLGFNISGPRLPSDVYSWSPDSPRAKRWTESETGGIPSARFVEPKLVSWKSFDGREISGFLYQPDPQKFPGPRPVIVNIHGGPEGQARPIFLARNNYLINDLGCAIIFPNVRGSTGYGKTFLLLDNGLKREDTYKDINALFDWVKTQPQLAADRIMVTGGSYGGHMTLAVATYYADRIRCALDVVGISNLRTFLEHTESYRRDLRRVE